MQPSKSIQKENDLSPDRRLIFDYESIYDPKFIRLIEAFDWLCTDRDVTNKICNADDLLAKSTKSVKIDWLHFTKCDFRGDFGSAFITFTECHFTLCDFASTFWSKAKFKKCTFDRSSMSVSTFVNCEFSNCKFSEISMSGGTTILSGTTFSNPETFIESCFLSKTSKSKPLDQNEALFSKKKNVIRKAEISRTLLANHMARGTIGEFYEINRVSSIYSIKETIAVLTKKHDSFDLRNINYYLKKSINIVDLYLTKSSGACNAWGESIARPIGIAAIVSIFFSLFYIDRFIGITWCEYLSALRKSVDVITLAGYSIHQKDNSTNLFVFFEMLFGIYIYSIIVATIVARISRVR